MSRLAFQHVAGGAEVADVGHATADEDLVDLLAGNLGQELDVVRIVRAGDDRLLDLAHVDLDGGRIFGVGVGCQERGRGEPGFHGGDAAFQRAPVLVAVGGHPFEQRHVRARVLDHRLRGEAHGAGGGRTFGRGVGQLECLLDLQGLAGPRFPGSRRRRRFSCPSSRRSAGRAGWRRRGWR